MKANEAYFQRLNGPWSFNPFFRILSWRGFLKADVSLVNKIRLASFVISQNIFGPYKMHTLVGCIAGASEVRHTTLVKKFGITLLRSEKIFSLGENGQDVTLSGAEFLWPMTCKAVNFVPMHGKIEISATRAKYGMPLVGLETECISLMESPQATIRIKLPWFEGIFDFTSESMKILNLRSVPQVDSL